MEWVCGTVLGPISTEAKRPGCSTAATLTDDPQRDLPRFMVAGGRFRPLLIDLWL
jgi:hypothetical protein